MSNKQVVTFPQVEFLMIDGKFDTISPAFDISNEDFTFLKKLMADITLDCYTTTPDTVEFIKKFIKTLSAPGCSETLRAFVLIQLITGFKRTIESRHDNPLMELLKAMKGTSIDG